MFLCLNPLLKCFALNLGGRVLELLPLLVLLQSKVKLLSIGSLVAVPGGVAHELTQEDVFALASLAQVSASLDGRGLRDNVSLHLLFL